jgi:hypothetical protein
MTSGHFAVAVERVLAGPHRPRRGVETARQDRRSAEPFSRCGSLHNF